MNTKLFATILIIIVIMLVAMFNNSGVGIATEGTATPTDYMWKSPPHITGKPPKVTVKPPVPNSTDIVIWNTMTPIPVHATPTSEYMTWNTRTPIAVVVRHISTKRYR